MVDSDDPRGSRPAAGTPERLKRVLGIDASVRFRPLVALPLVAVLVLSLAAVPVLGQGGQCTASEPTLEFDIPEIEGDTYQKLIAPGTTESIDVTLTYAWESGSYSVDPIEIRRDGTTPFSHARAGWMETSLNESPPIYVDVPSEAGGSGGSKTIPLTLNLTVSEDAPSDATTFVWLEARAEQSCDGYRGNIPGTAFTDNTWKFTSGHLPQVRVTPDQKLVQLRGGESLDVPVEVANTGNVDVSAGLEALEVPDGIGVEINSSVRVDHEGTAVVPMTITSDSVLSQMREEFILQAKPRWTEDAAVAGPTTRTNVVVAVRNLPSAVLLGQQNIAEVLIFTGVIVGISFAAGWPLTAWWENRRKAAGRAPFGSGSSPRSGSSDDDDDDGGKTVHGVPKEGDDYEIVTSDRDVFSARKVHGIPKEGPDYEVVEEDDLFDDS